MLLGTSEQAYTYGFYGILYTLGMASGLMILGSGVAARLRSLNVETTAQLFETRYRSPELKKVASALSVLTMAGILIGNIVGSKALLTGMGISSELIFLGFWAFVIAYTMAGGLTAVVLTDIFQVLYIIAVFGAIFMYCMWTDPISWFSLPVLIQKQNLFAQETITTNIIIATIVMPAFFSLIEQDLAQRFFAARTKKIAALSAIASSLFLLLFSVIPIYLGMKAQLLELQIPAGASPLIPVLQTLIGEAAVLFAICGVVAAITSTADSLLCAISSNVVQDFDYSWTGIKNQLTLSKYITLLIGIITVYASYFVPQNIIGVMISSYELSVSCLFVPLIICYFKKDVQKKAAQYAVICGAFGFIVFRFYPTSLPKEIAALALSLLGYITGQIFSQSQKPD